MLNPCLSVVRFTSRRYSSDHLYCAAVFIAVPNAIGDYVWEISHFVGDIHSREMSAVIDCCRLCGLEHGPYVADANDTREVDVAGYNAACVHLGVPRSIPATPDTSSPAPESKGAGL